MSTKKEFLEELATHVAGLQEGMEGIKRTIESNDAEIRANRDRRAQAIETLVTTLLPDLTPVTVAALAQRLPGFVTAAEVDKMRADWHRAYGDQLKTLLTEFDPATAETDRMQVELDLKGAIENRDALRGPFGQLTALLGLKRLIQSGYGTDGYAERWWNLQFYRDWKRADEILEATGTEDWTELRRRYLELETNLGALEEEAGGLQKRLDRLTDNAKLHRQLIEALAHVDATVLDELHVKLKARLDGVTDLAETAAFEKRIAERQAENTQLQETRLKLSEQLTGLHQLAKQAKSSRLREVPDNYVQTLRDARYRPSAGGTTPAQTVTYVQNDHSLLDLLIISEMASHFSHAPTPEPLHRDDYTSAVRHEAQHDWSGQS